MKRLLVLLIFLSKMLYGNYEYKTVWELFGDKTTMSPNLIYRARGIILKPLPIPGLDTTHKYGVDLILKYDFKIKKFAIYGMEVFDAIVAGKLGKKKNFLYIEISPSPSFKGYNFRFYRYIDKRYERDYSERYGYKTIMEIMKHTQVITVYFLDEHKWSIL